MAQHEHGQTDEYGLVMPFVVVQSADGPYDDGAYAAGYEAGQLDIFLGTIRLPPGGRLRYPVAVRRANAPQLDLIAMKHGLSAVFEDSEVGEWLFLQIAREA